MSRHGSPGGIQCLDTVPREEFSVQTRFPGGNQCPTRLITGSVDSSSDRHCFWGFIPLIMMMMMMMMTMMMMMVVVVVVVVVVVPD